jgi:hypothetical protein
VLSVRECTAVWQSGGGGVLFGGEASTDNLESGVRVRVRGGFSERLVIGQPTGRVDQDIIGLADVSEGRFESLKLA